MDNCSKEPFEMTINRLEEENAKLREEIRLLNDKMIEYTNIVKHIEYNVRLSVNQIKHDIFVQY